MIGNMQLNAINANIESNIIWIAINCLGLNESMCKNIYLWLVNLTQEYKTPTTNKTFDIFIVRRKDDVDHFTTGKQNWCFLYRKSHRSHDNTKDLIDKIFLDIFKFLFIFKLQ